MMFVVELEGFQLKVGFCVKECSIFNLNTGEKTHFFVKAGNDFNTLNLKDKASVWFAEKNIHNIYWDAGP